MARKPVFYSFHFRNDVFRVQQIRNMGVLDGNEPTSPNRWEEIRRAGSSAVERWVNENMKYKRCLIALVGQQTASRPWVLYEIEKAWSDGKGVFGIYIHNLKCPKTGTCGKGQNPFDRIKLNNGKLLSDVVDCYDPHPMYAYSEIQDRIQGWVESAINQRGLIR